MAISGVLGHMQAEFRLEAVLRALFQSASHHPNSGRNNRVVSGHTA